MSRIFVCDDGTPIPFYVDTYPNDIIDQILGHGGISSSILDAHIYISTGDNALVSPINSRVPVLRPSWVTESIEAKRMVPIYPHLDDENTDRLSHLPSAERDKVELLKAVAGSPEDGIFKTLHHKFPHNSTLMWRALHEESKHQLQMVLLDVVASHKGNLNEQILPMFPQSIPFEQQTVGKEMEPPNEILIPRTPVKKWEDTGEVEYPEEMGEEYFDDPTGADSRAPHSPQEEPTWMPPGQQPVPFPFMGDSDREEEYADYGDEEEGDSKYADSGGPRSVSYSSFSTGDNKFKKGVPFTSAHHSPQEEPTWMPPGQQPVPFPFMDDSDREEEYADYGDEEEGDSKYADSGGPRSVSYSSFSTGDNKFKKGVPFTSAHYKSMVEFYREAGPTLRAADWVTFWNRAEANQVRSVDAWRREWNRRGKALLAAAADGHRETPGEQEL